MTAPSRRSPHTPTLPTWHVATSDSVRAILATTYATDHPPTTIGDVTLMPHQRDALARIRATIREFHGALLADEVGLGKTYVALALAHDYQHTHVVAPAALLPMWRTAIARTASQHIQLHSLHAFSRTPPTTPGTAYHGPTAPGRHTLVIIDEAHHLRTRNTRRYHAIADFVAGRDLLLLSATPIHNTSRELRHLLALFAGLRDDLLTPELLARLIIRHTTTGSTDASPPRARHITPPAVHEHPPLRIPHDRETLDGILALPSPLPARDGAVAGALIRLGLLRAWCSSEAALTHTIQRRILRGEALKQALIAGRHPTQAELRTWLVGEHEVQLAFPELLVSHTAQSGPLLDVLTQHLNALQSLLERQRLSRVSDERRANTLREIVARHPNTPVVAFSQFTRTVQSLYRALSDIAGVGALTGMHAHIASGRIARHDAIARFAPTAQGRPPPPPHQAIRLLLSTDILAEGVNLQDAGVVVHLDLPWTDALRRQRVGRVARIGSEHELVHVYSFAPPRSGDRALALTARLLTKAKLAAHFIGKPITQTHNPPLTTSLKSKPPTHHPNPQPKTGKFPAPADLSTTLHTTFHRWRAAAPTSTVTTRSPDHTRVSNDIHTNTPHHSIPIAQLVASRTGWLAAISTTLGPQLVAHTTATGTEPARIWQLISPLGDARELARKIPAATSNPQLRHVSDALRQLTAWLVDRDISDSTGPARSSTSRAQTLARQRLAQVISTAPPLSRHALSAAIRAAEHVIEAAIGIGAETALEAWARWEHNPQHEPPLPTSSARWLTAWHSHPALCRSDLRSSVRGLQPSAVSAAPADAPDSAHATRILGLLLFRTTPS